MLNGCVPLFRAGIAPAKSKQEHLDFVKAKARFMPDRPDNRDFHQEIKKASEKQSKAPFGTNATTRAATERFTRAAAVRTVAMKCMQHSPLPASLIAPL